MNTKYAFVVLLFSILFSVKSFSQWNTNPAINTPMCTAVNRQIDLRIIEDDKGGAIIVWKDFRNVSTVPDIYAQRISSAGFNLWTPNGSAICTNVSDQSTPDILPDMAGGAIISWSDWRSGIERDLYAQRIDSNGIVKWTTDGIIVTNKPEREHNQKMGSDWVGGAIICWEQQNSVTGQWDIFAQRINSLGAVMWVAGGIPICNFNGDQLNARIQSDTEGGAIITWQDFRNGFE